MYRLKKHVGWLFCMLAAYAFANGPITIGEHVPEDLETAHPYPRGESATASLVQTDLVHYPKATYIAVHFARMELAPGDFVVVRSPDSKQFWRYTENGRHNLGITAEGFFATHVKGDMAVVELWSVSGREQSFGYAIDFYGRGYNDHEIQEFWDAGYGEEMNLPQPSDNHNESVCTTDDTREVKCYQNTEPLAYEAGRAVARLTLNGSAHCTGWLIGCEGHLMTNEHCIGSQSTLNNIDFEFMAEGDTCEQNCASSLACAGTIEASGGTLVQVDAPLDYALVIPDTSTGAGTDLPGTYGYMQLRPTGAVIGERIYIAQHPAGWGKRLAMESSYPGEDGLAHVVSITEPVCAGGTADVGYWADTQGGSSGSPVLGYSDNLVVALHHCRGSNSCTSGGGTDDPNRAVPIQDVIASLGPNLPQCATCVPPEDPTSLSLDNATPNQVVLSWPAVAGASSYTVLRAIGDCTTQLSDYEELASGITQTTYMDTSASGSVTYAYLVKSVDDATGCVSIPGVCDSITATGDCLQPPLFAGLNQADTPQTKLCSVDLSWDAATAFCGDLVYNIYRDSTSGFTPGPSNLVASCVTGTSYSDHTAESGVTYYYVVRAEDNSGNGNGPCGSGLEDNNTVEVAASAYGPDQVAFEDDMESGTANWVAVAGPLDPGTEPWFQVTDQSNSPTHSWFVAELDSEKDQTLAFANPVALPDIPGLKLTFFHNYDTESTWDGGVLEFSTDGTTWLDILDGNEDRFIKGGYVTNLRGGPLGLRQAWSGDSGGWTDVEVSLEDFRGTNLWLRWRLSCDGTVTDTGWWLDDVRLISPTECSADLPPFTMDMWHDPGKYLGAYDDNGNGAIDITEVLAHMMFPALSY